LANHFLSYYCQEYQLTPPEVCSEVSKLFSGYEWPGNVRELQNVIQHAVLMAESKSIGLCDLPEYMQPGSCAELSFLEVRDREAENVEKPFLEDLLRKHHGNISKAAAEAKLSRKTIYRLAKRFSFDLGQFR
jgi:DNA-binding NtrC family response regulator